MGLDKYLDGRQDRVRCEKGEKACWICDRRNGIKEELTGIEKEREEARLEYERLERKRQRIREQMQ